MVLTAHAHPASRGIFRLDKDLWKRRIHLYKTRLHFRNQPGAAAAPFEDANTKSEGHKASFDSSDVIVEFVDADVDDFAKATTTFPPLRTNKVMEEEYVFR